MSGKNDEIILQRIQLIPDRGNYLLEVSSREVRPSYTAMKERISTEHTIRAADQAHAPGSMARGMYNLKCERTESKACALIEQHMPVSLYLVRRSAVDQHILFF